MQAIEPEVTVRLPFEQQERESEKAFAAFSLYLSLGPQRSLEAVATKLGKSKTLMERWCRPTQREPVDDATIYKLNWQPVGQAQTVRLAELGRELAESETATNGRDEARRQERR